MRASIRCAAGASVLSLFLSVAQAGQTVFHYTSEPGDYIGIGGELTLTSADADFFVSRNFGGGVSVHMNNFSFPNPPTFVFWTTDFAAPFGAELTVGAYEGATRFPFNQPHEPGLAVYGDGRGCNSVTGRFDVLEAVYDPNTGDVVAFAADFEQHCEGVEPALFGSLRINSDVPLPVIIAPRIVVENPLNIGGCVEAAGRRGARVNLGAVTIVPGDYSYLWSTSTGATGSGPGFSFKVGVGETAGVTLTATEATSGNQATSMTQVCVSDTMPPEVTIHQPVEGAVIRGNPTLELSASDTVDDDLGSVHVFVGHTADLALPPKGKRLRTKLPPAQSNGDGTMTEIIVEATDDAGNTGQASVRVVIEHRRDRDD